MWSVLTQQLIEAAYDEDVGPGDLTAALVADAATEVMARVVPRQAGILAGLALGPVICTTFGERLNTHIRFEPREAPLPPALPFAPPPSERSAAGDARQAAPQGHDGAAIVAGATVATVTGSKAAVLSTERTLLNFLSRMSGVATLTRRYVDAAQAGNPNVQILDTRKTVPGWRDLDKYAVRCGGGANHRQGLYDAVLIKDNHIAGIPLPRLAEELTGMLARIPRQPAFVEVEVDSLEQLREVLRVGAVDVVLLDNFTPEQMRAAVAERNARRRAPGGMSAVEIALFRAQYAAQSWSDTRPDTWIAMPLALEASGGVTLDNVAEIAATGVDRISVGALTHSAVALDIGLDFA